MYANLFKNMSDIRKTADPCVMVIFGATGDLTKRKLFPALYNLAKGGFLPEDFAIVGVGRQEMETNDYRSQIRDNLREFCPETGRYQAAEMVRGADVLHRRRFR